jgi:hypothetical protein
MGFVDVAAGSSWRGFSASMGPLAPIRGFLTGGCVQAIQPLDDSNPLLLVVNWGALIPNSVPGDIFHASRSDTEPG